MNYRYIIPIAALLIGSEQAISAALSEAGVTNADCAPFHVRLDPSTWNTSQAADLGSSIGQTFFTEDTLIAGIKVWLPPYPSSSAPIST
jgi:hypothetical protein